MKTVFDFAKTADTPFVVKNQLKYWPLLNHTERDWCSVFSNEITFRKGSKAYSKTPQWERTCSNETLEITKFFQISKKENCSFLYFDYKPVKHVFNDKSQIIESIKWADLGVPPHLCKDSTIWIGNNGAHTPCHMDTYGDNLVAQLFGRKRWLLISPRETKRMKPSRVPYEESSIYSLLNFFTPTNELLNINEMFDVTLEPGDVLFVPRHWWHFVENLEVAVSVNTWMPSDKDINSRLEEALVQRYIWSLCQDLTEDESKEILNPNEDTLITSQPSDEVLQQVLLECLQGRKREPEICKEPVEISNSIDVNFLKPISLDDVKKYIASKAKLYNYDSKIIGSFNVDYKNRLDVSKALINSMCHPDTINMAKEKLIQQFDT